MPALFAAAAACVERGPPGAGEFTHAPAQHPVLLHVFIGGFAVFIYGLARTCPAGTASASGIDYIIDYCVQGAEARERAVKLILTGTAKKNRRSHPL